MMQKAFLIGMFFMMFVTPYIMCKGVWLLTYNDIEFRDKVKCAIPIYNLYLAETIYGGGIPTVFIGTIALIVVFLLRLLEVFLSVPSVIAMITIVILILLCITWYILNAVLVFRILHSADYNNLATQIIMSVFFPFGQYYIGGFLYGLMKYQMEEEDIFG